jgi:hypothetical protein
MRSSDVSVGERFAQAVLAKDWGRNRVVYRFRARKPDGDYVCEQTAHYDEAKGRITNLRILCTGFLPSTDDRVPAIDLMTAEA